MKEMKKTIDNEIKSKAQKYVDKLYKEYAGKGTLEGDLAVIQKKRDSFCDFIEGATWYRNKLKYSKRNGKNNR